MISKILRLNQLRVQKKINDEYLNWLTFANAGMLDQGNVYCMDMVIKNLPSDAPIIEIGSFCGLSTNVMTYLTHKHGKNNAIITSDKWVFEMETEDENHPERLGGSPHITHQMYRAFVIDTFKRNVQFFSRKKLPYPIQVFSDEFFELWEKESNVKDIFDRDIKLGGKISFAYIDGNHTYDYVRRDFQNVSRYLEVGGYILFDDSADYTNWGSAKFMSEVSKDSNYKLCIKNPNYLFQKIKD